MTIQMAASILFYLAIAISTTYMASKVKITNSYLLIKKKNFVTHERFINRTYIIGIFVILFLCSAFRFGIGNDYIQYTETAHEAFVGGYVVTEIGFNKLVSFVYFLFGGEYYEIVFALFAFVTLIFFLKAMYEQSISFSYTFFLFMTMGLYFQTYNTIRYYLALSISLYSLRYVVQRKWIKFISSIIFASLFHKSVLIVIPLYIIASVHWRKWQIAVGILLCIICNVCKGLVLSFALELYPSYKNTIYLEGGTSIVSIVRGIAIISLYVWVIAKYIKPNQAQNNKYTINESINREMTIYAKLNFLAVIAYTFFSFLPVITRIGYYLSLSQILLIPLLIKNIPETKSKKYISLIVTITSIVYFVAFLGTANRFGVRLLPYKSWLFMDERLHY